MGFLGSLFGGVVKIALTPVAVVTDVVKVATGNEADTTKNLIDSATDDFEDAFDGE